MRVLLVEDDRMIGQVVQDALKDASCAADWVEDGQAALDALATDIKKQTIFKVEI